MSLINVKNNSDKIIKFSFSYDNGLAYKPSLTPDYKLFSADDENNNSIWFYQIYLNKEEAYKIKEETLQNIHYINEGNNIDIWYSFDNHYIIVPNILEIAKKAKQKKCLFVEFLDENKNVFATY